ncbi:MAG: hypothetical protein FWC27_13385 [Firmicutes bacterium]|nr:hypothetical protein [Bacillota bacterium]
MRKNKKLIMALAILLAIATATAGATFAWYTSIDSVDNHMETGQFSNGDVKIAEIFNEGDPFDPGVDINKDVWVVNTSNSKAIIRVSFAEILTMLSNGGAPVAAAALWAGATGTIPQIVSPNAFLAGGAFDAVTAGQFVVVTAATMPAGLTYAGAAIPAGVTLLCRTETSGVAPNVKTTYEFVAYGTIAGTVGTDPYAGELQRVEFDMVQTGSTVTFSNWEFMQFTKAATITSKWANFPAGQYPVESAYAGGPHAIDLPGLAPLYAGESRVPAISDPGDYINLLFTSYVKTSLAACVAGDWWYNDADGFFYYIGKLDDGQASSRILDAVGLHSNATSAYCLLDFDLIVKMEAIQNVKEAMSTSYAAGGGWGIDITTGWGLALYNALNGVGAFVL